MKIIITTGLGIILSLSAYGYDATRVNQAIEMDNVGFISSLIESGDLSVDEKIPSQGYKYAPLITLAGRSAAHRVINFLIQRKVDLNAKTSAGETALMLAAFFKDEDGSYEPGYQQHEKAVRTLVEAGADLENDINSYTPLSYSAYQGHIRIVKYLTAKGANIDGNSVNGENSVNTPLMMAILTDQQEIGLHLLRLGANVKIRKGEETALSLAKRYNRTRFVRYISCAESLQPGQKFSEKCE